MYKTDRYYDKKRNGQHNFFGEEEYVPLKKGATGTSVIQEEQAIDNIELHAEEEQN